jgi:hypothetical protein
MGHPPESPDLAPYDFFFGCTKEQVKGKGFAAEEEPLSMVCGLMSEISPCVILLVFAAWDRGLQPRLLMKGEYAEQSFKLKWFSTGLDKCARRILV